MYSVALPYKRRIHFDGNSLVNLSGTGTSPGTTQGYYLGTKTMSSLTSTTTPIYNCYGVGSKRTPALTADFPTKILPNFQKGDIVIMWEITNDAHDEILDTTGAILYSHVVDYCNMVRSYGGYIILITGIARDMTGFDDVNITDRIFACNALIRANAATICDGVADFGALSIFDAKADVTNTTYYMTDQTHIKNAAYNIAAPVLATVIDNVLSIASKQVIFDGNSLTNTDGTLTPNTYYLPLVLFDTLKTNNKDFFGRKVGVSGKDTVQLIADFPTKIAPYLKVDDVVILWEITNDLRTNSATAQQAYDNVVTYVNLVRALGAKCVVIGFIARDYTGDAIDINTRGFACNALLLANPSVYDGFVDVGANAAFDTKADASNATYYLSDKLHLTNVGYSLVSSLIEPTIRRLI